MIGYDLINEDLNEIGEYLKADDYVSAYDMISELLSEHKDKFKEEDEIRYFNFDSPIQFYIYNMKLSPEKNFKQGGIDFRTLYMCKAHIEIFYENYKEAEESLKKALYWNPVDPNIFYELARVFIKTGELQKLLIVLKAVRSYILDKVSYSKYYAYMGEYYRLKEDYKTALSLYLLSKDIFEIPVSNEGITFILGKEDIKNPPVTEEIISTLKKEGLEYSLDMEVLGMIYDLSYELSKQLNNKSAIYCLDVLYELTGDEKYLREKEYLE